MLFSVDRIEGTYAVLIDECGKPLQVPLAMLFTGVKSGDMLLYEENQFLLTQQQTKQRRETMAKVLSQMLQGANKECEMSQRDIKPKKGDKE